jgi:hypothetical protein
MRTNRSVRHTDEVLRFVPGPRPVRIPPDRCRSVRGVQRAIRRGVHEPVGPGRVTGIHTLSFGRLIADVTWSSHNEIARTCHERFGGGCLLKRRQSIPRRRDGARDRHQLLLPWRRRPREDLNLHHPGPAHHEKAEHRDEDGAGDSREPRQRDVRQWRQRNCQPITVLIRRFVGASLP